MNKYLSFISLGFILMLGFRASANEMYTMPRTQVIPIVDSQSNKQYELYIKLPDGYEQNKDKKYPVIYFTDAVWHIELLSAATEFILDEVILVGISWQLDTTEGLRTQYGAHASRFTDYSFWDEANPDHPKLKFGQADSHLAFIRNDVITFVEKTFRVNSNNRSYFGYSLGGLFGAYTLLKQQDTFQNYILGSPSVQLLTKYNVIDKFKNTKLNANVFITNGDLEKERGEHIEAFMKQLKSANNKNLSIKHVVISGDHSSAFPSTGVSSISWLVNLLLKETEK